MKKKILASRPSFSENNKKKKGPENLNKENGEKENDLVEKGKKW